MKDKTLPDRTSSQSVDDPAALREATLLKLAREIACDAHRSPREYIRRANTQQQGE